MATERPVGVTLVAAVQAANAVATGLEVVAGERAVPSDEGAVLVAAGVAIVVGGLLVSLGLWRLQRWAWTATMVWVGVVMALALSSYFHGNPSYVVMGLSVMQVFYLNQSEVQRVFAGGTEATG
ncbi:MAG: hypothetical protein M0R74_14750 [Dehalococcoidia bacterium]|nr:hypothetical protein [Dehalococcoidia bacterium]